MRILVTGAAGFLGGYAVQELLDHGHAVVGLDNYSKYGPVERSYDGHPRYSFVEADAKDPGLLKELLAECDQMVAAAAMVGGIAYFHELAYDLLAENERITASSFDAALWAWKNRGLKKINVVSSSMVFEGTGVFPTPEGEQWRCPPPRSSYGFQKLACEVFAAAAREQHGLPYTVIRPFNAVGIGERRARSSSETPSGNLRLAMSHVVPDLVQKALRGQDPLRILGSGRQVRHYTYAGDLARGIRLCVESAAAENEDFNLSTPVPTTVLELARAVWRQVRGDEPFRVASDEPYRHDVPTRSPDVEKARRLLGFEALTPLDAVLDEVVPWVRAQLLAGGL